MAKKKRTSKFATAVVAQDDCRKEVVHRFGCVHQHVSAAIRYTFDGIDGIHNQQVAVDSAIDNIQYSLQTVFDTLTKQLNDLSKRVSNLEYQIEKLEKRKGR
jgi:hypothetical protein